MYKLFEFLFIKKKYQDKETKNLEITKEVRTAYGTLTSILGIICNLFLCACKIIAGIISASISLTADGINNLTDGASSIATLVGFKLAAQPADKDHPYGHERVEYVFGMIISLFILVVGILLGKSSIEKIINKEEMDLTRFYLLAGILVGSILIKCWMGLMYHKASKTINSLTIKASSQDSFNDCISTGAVLISLIIAYLFNVNLDAYLGVAVSIFILVNGIMLVKETMSPLIGEAPDKDFVDDMVKKILSYDGILGVHDLVMHQYGPGKLFVTIHAEVDSSVDIMISHEIIDTIERDFINEKGIEMTIHLDPVMVNDEFTNELKSILKDVINNLENVNISFHDFRIVKGEKNTNVLFDIVRPYDCVLSKDELVRLIKKEFIEKAKEINNMNYNLIIEVDNNYV